MLRCPKDRQRELAALASTLVVRPIQPQFGLLLEALDLIWRVPAVMLFLLFMGKWGFREEEKRQQEKVLCLWYVGIEVCEPVASLHCCFWLCAQGLLCCIPTHAPLLLLGWSPPPPPTLACSPPLFILFPGKCGRGIREPWGDVRVDECLEQALCLRTSRPAVPYLHRVLGAMQGGIGGCRHVEAVLRSCLAHAHRMLCCGAW